MSFAGANDPSASDLKSSINISDNLDQEKWRWSDTLASLLNLVGIVCGLLLAGRCVECSSRSMALQIPSSWVAIGVTFVILSFITNLIGWRYKKSVSLRDIVLALNVAPLLGLPLLSAHISVTGQSPCILCLAFWLSTIGSAALRSLVTSWARSVLIASICSFGIVRFILNMPDQESLIRKNLTLNLLCQLGDCQLNASQRFKVGEPLPKTLAKYSGFVFVATKCPDCTKKRALEAISKNLIPVSEIYVLRSTDAPDWVIPFAEQNPRILTDKQSWEWFAMKERGAPLIFRAENGVVQKVISE